MKTEPKFPRRGEIYWINFEPSLGQEIKKRRPAIIVSNDIANKFLKRFQVIPVTSSIDKIYPSETVVTIAGKKSKAMADQIFTASELRFGKLIGKLSAHDLAALDAVIRLQLGLNEAGDKT